MAGGVLRHEVLKRLVEFAEVIPLANLNRPALGAIETGLVVSLPGGNTTRGRDSPYADQEVRVKQLLVVLERPFESREPSLPPLSFRGHLQRGDEAPRGMMAGEKLDFVLECPGRNIAFFGNVGELSLALRPWLDVLAFLLDIYRQRS